MPRNEPNHGCVGSKVKRVERLFVIILSFFGHEAKAMIMSSNVNCQISFYCDIKFILQGLIYHKHILERQLILLIESVDATVVTFISADGSKPH